MEQLLKIRVGSHAYGTNIETSDEDYIEVHACSLEELHGFNYREEVVFNKDHKSLELKKFLNLLLKANPNILELLFADESNILFKHECLEPLFKNRQMFITKECFKTFGNYAISQIKKATSLDKKTHWENNRIERKDVLDFCYVLEEGSEKATKFKEYLFDLTPLGYIGRSIKISPNTIGLAKVNNFRDVYSMYYMEQYGGVVNENSNEVQTRSIPKGSVHLGYLRFDKDAYSTHCKDYKEYKHWLETRNIDRYTWDVKEQVYNMKNLMHCRRLLNVALEIGEQGTFSVFRKEKEELIAIRRGNVNVKLLMEKMESDMEYLKTMLENSNLPEKADEKFVEDLLIKIRNSANKN